MAFGKDEAGDVTRRYVADYTQCLGRRTECTRGGWRRRYARSPRLRARSGRSDTAGDSDAMDATSCVAGAHVPAGGRAVRRFAGADHGSVRRARGAWRARQGKGREAG